MAIPPLLTLLSFNSWERLMIKTTKMEHKVWIKQLHNLQSDYDFCWARTGWRWQEAFASDVTKGKDASDVGACEKEEWSDIQNCPKFSLVSSEQNSATALWKRKDRLRMLTMPIKIKRNLTNSEHKEAWQYVDPQSYRCFWVWLGLKESCMQCLAAKSQRLISVPGATEKIGINVRLKLVMAIVMTI